VSDSDTKGGDEVAKFNLNQLLNNVSVNSATEESEINKVNAFKVSSISVYDLTQSKENFYSVEKIEELKDSIEMFGIKQNLIVKATEDGKYIVIAGHRRRLASLALVEEGKKEFEFVPCSIENDLDYIKEQLLLITTNSTTRQLTDWEKTQQAEKIKKLLEEYKKKEKLPGRIREIIASILNTSSTQVARMDSISKNLTQEFKEELKDEKINISTAYELSTLPGKVQENIYIDHTENGGVSLNDVKEKKAEFKLEVEEVIEQIENPKEIIREELEPKKEILLPMPSLYKILKEFNLSELAEFICSRCDSIGRFCDYAVECNQSKKTKRQDICIRWLEMQAQKRN
jgi:ParB family chromosome partitioning protein